MTRYAIFNNTSDWVDDISYDSIEKAEHMAKIYVIDDFDEEGQTDVFYICELKPIKKIKITADVKIEETNDFSEEDF